MVIYLQMRKTIKAKTPPGDFKVTIPKNPLVNNQTITSKMNLTNYPWSIPNYQPTVKFSLQYPIRLDFVMALFSFNARNPVRDSSIIHRSQYMTNSNNLKKVASCKALHFMQNKDQEAPWLQNPLA